MGLARIKGTWPALSKVAGTTDRTCTARFSLTGVRQELGERAEQDVGSSEAEWHEEQERLLQDLETRAHVTEGHRGAAQAGERVGACPVSRLLPRQGGGLREEAAGGGEVAAQEAQASLAGPTERLALRLAVGPRRRDQRVRGAGGAFEIAGRQVGPEHDGACPALDPMLARLDSQVDRAHQWRQGALRRRHHQIHAAGHQGGREIDALAGRLENGDACFQRGREPRIGVEDLGAVRFVACDRRDDGIVGRPADHDLVVELPGLSGARLHAQTEGELAVEVPQQRPVAPGGGGEAQRGAGVTFLGGDALPPNRPLRLSRDGPLRGLEEIAHPACVARADVLVLAGLAEAFERELTHGLEQVEARDPVLLAAGEQALVGQRRQAVQRVDAGVGGDLGGRLFGEAAGEHAQASEERLLVGAQEVIAPGERGAQRLLARRQIAPLAREQGE